MLFPAANPADVFNRLSSDDTVFHVGPGTGKVLFNAYRKCAASFVISEPDAKIASELKSALLSSPSVDLIDQAVVPDGADVELHHYSPPPLNTLTKAEEPVPTLRGARHIHSVRVRGIDPVAYLMRKRADSGRSDILVVSSSALHLGALVQLQAAQMLSRFEHIIIRCNHANTGPAQLDQVGELLKDCDFDAQSLYATSAQSESLGLFRRNRLADEVARLKTIVRAHADEIEALRGDCMRAEASIENVEALAQEQSDLAEKCESELAAEREQVATLKVEESKLIAKLATLDGQLKETNKAVKAGDKKLSQVTRKLERAEQGQERMSALREDLILTRKSRDDLSSKLDAAVRLQSSLREDLADLQTRYGELIDSKQQQDELVTRLIDKLSSPRQVAKPPQNPPKRSKISNPSKRTAKRSSAAKTVR